MLNEPNLLSGLIDLFIIILSAILHEIAHGLVADKLGDPTARLAGRLTLNPKKHIDFFMSIVVPALLIISHSPIVFGAAKPVPVDPFNLKDGKKDVAIVSLAGPLTNILIAILGALVIKLLLTFSPMAPSDNMSNLVVALLYLLFVKVVYWNLLLAIFNLLPIPPLDGSKIFALILPEREAAVYLSLGSIGFFLLLLLLVVPIGGFSLNGFIFTLLTFSQRLLGI